MMHLLKYVPLAALLIAPLPAAANCFDLQKSEPHELSGLLSHQIFAGPPEFEDVQKGDAPEPGYLLKLDEPICLTDDDGFTDPDYGFDEVQLVSTDATDQAMVTLQGSRVHVVLEDPTPAITGHHHRPLVAWVTEIEAENDTSPLATYADPAATTVKAFYLALGSGDGASASGFVVSEKTAKGPFSVAALSNFYGGLPERLQLLAIRKVGSEQFVVRYHFRSTTGSCDGKARVTTVQRNGRSFIQTIKAMNGC